jgi:PAS domain S-box-containing protein
MMSEDTISYIKSLENKLKDYEKHIAQLELKLKSKEKKTTLKEDDFLTTTEVLSNQGSWKWNILKDKWTFSRNWLNIHGVDSNFESIDELLKVAHPEDRDGIKKILEKTLETKESITAESRIYKQNTKELRWIRATAGVELNNNGEVVALIGVARDITDEKIISEKLIENQDFLKKTGEIAKIGGWYLSSDFKKLFWTEGTYDIHELAYDQPVKLEEAINFYHPDDQELVSRSVDDGIKSGQSYQFEARIITAKGNIKWVYAKGEPEMKDGKCVKLSGIFQDITERKKAERKVNMLTRAVDYAISGFDIVNHEGKFIYVNKAHSKMFGFDKPSDIIGTSPSRLCADPKFPEILIKNLREYGEYVCELKGKRKDGTKFDLLMHSRIDYDENGNEIYPTTSIDITERLKNERELIESKQKFESIFKNSSVAKILADDRGNFIDVNDKMCELLGYTYKEFKKITVLDIIRNKSSIELYRTFNKEPIRNGEIEIVRKDGEVRIVEFYEKKISKNRHLSTLIDITEKRKNEEEKIKTQQQLEDITNSIPGTIFQFVFKKDGTLSMPYLNSKASSLFGFQNKKMRDPKFLFSRIYSEDYQSTINSIFEANHDQASWSKEFRAVNNQNKIVWIHAHSYGTADKNGNIIHNGVFYDITRRKEAEKALKQSQQQYRNLEDNLPGVLSKIKMNKDGSDELLYMSKGSTSLFELEPCQVVENPQIIWDRIHKDDLENMMSSFKTSAKNLTLWESEYRFLFPDGRQKWINIRGVPSQQEDGTIIWDAIGLDITKRKEAEQELEKINKHLENLVEERAQKAINLSKELELYWLAAKHSKSGVWSYDIESHQLKWDQILYDLFGVNKGDFDSDFEAWKAILHPDDKNKVINLFKNAIENKTDLDSTFRIIQYNTGYVRYIRGKGKVKLDEEGKIISVFGTNWDITNEMQLAEERELTLNNLKRTQEQLVETEKMASLGVLTDGVAHELNNPLNYIMGGYTAIHEQLEDYKTLNRNELKEYLNWIKSGSDRATKIVKNLNLLSSKRNNNFETCDLHQIIEDCLLLLHNKYQDNIRIVKKFSDSVLKIEGNFKKLHEAFFNILFNAIDAIEEKGVIEIITESKNDWVIIDLIDNGCGIPKEVMKKIMDPFFTTKPPGKGTGLGLSITNSVVKEHKGHLKITSEYGIGTKVSIHFPK